MTASHRITHYVTKLKSSQSNLLTWQWCQCTQMASAVTHGCPTWYWQDVPKKERFPVRCVYYTFRFITKGLNPASKLLFFQMFYGTLKKVLMQPKKNKEMKSVKESISLSIIALHLTFFYSNWFLIHFQVFFFLVCFLDDCVWWHKFVPLHFLPNKPKHKDTH